MNMTCTISRTEANHVATVIFIFYYCVILQPNSLLYQLKILFASIRFRKSETTDPILTTNECTCCFSTNAIPKLKFLDSHLTLWTVCHRRIVVRVINAIFSRYPTCHTGRHGNRCRLRLGGIRSDLQTQVRLFPALFVIGCVLSS